MSGSASFNLYTLVSSFDHVENQVIFEGDRLEPRFSDVPGQWGTIWLTQGSTNHEFSYTTIKNSVVGILMDNNDGGVDPTLTLKNVEIYNISNVGLSAAVKSDNFLFSNKSVGSNS